MSDSTSTIYNKIRIPLIFHQRETGENTHAEADNQENVHKTRMFDFPGPVSGQDRLSKMGNHYGQKDRPYRDKQRSGFEAGDAVQIVSQYISGKKTHGGIPEDRNTYFNQQFRKQFFPEIDPERRLALGCMRLPLKSSSNFDIDYDLCNQE